MEIQEVQTPLALEKAYLVLKELRQDLEYTEFTSLYEASHKADGYRLLAVFDEGHCLAVMGCRVLHDFVHGRHLYVDDLVVTQTRRSKGIGAILLKHAEKLAYQLGCKNMRLCTAIANESGRRFYEREGWLTKSVALKKNTPIYSAALPIGFPDEHATA